MLMRDRLTGVGGGGAKEERVDEIWVGACLGIFIYFFLKWYYDQIFTPWFFEHIM